MIVCPKIYLLIYVTWDNDITSRDNYIMMSRQPSSWIRHRGFQNFSKTSENSPKLLKNTMQKNSTKNPKRGENGNTKITNLGKHVCENDVSMATSSFRHNNLSYQSKSVRAISTPPPPPPPPPGLDKVKYRKLH